MKIILIFMCLLLSSTAYALDATNIEAGQEGTKAYFKYDLMGLPGEKAADISVQVTINGNIYESEKLQLRGDFGNKIAVGRNKKIYWDVLKDMPAGYEGNISWSISAKLNDTIYDPLKMLSKSKKAKLVFKNNVLQDIESNLMWPLNTEFGAVNSLQQAIEVTNKLNYMNYSGYNDWRVPTKEEWERLIAIISENYGYTRGHSVSVKLNQIGFKKISSDYYWTSEMTESESRYGAQSSQVKGGKIVAAHFGMAAVVDTYKTETKTVERKNADLGTYNAVINLRDSYIYKMQLVSSYALLLPVRSGIHANTINCMISVAPQ